ncbi:fibrinogen C domain-containing protein 1-like [Aplysia californica]|uniref:Fibrinogen C domain-containing protein 1-like n=1 Tax=Aplysia californica TaxID=6500 RepID=A0ABM0JN62_APLCA|nr:fibrinogen C domain-containing protein 1-like [Aplysia californica]
MVGTTQISHPESIFQQSVVGPAHQSDVLRLNLLNTYGGAYQTLSHTVEVNKRECPHQMLSQKRQILETVTSALERNQREVLQQSQRLLRNTSAAMGEVLASLEKRLSDVEHKLLPQSCASVKGLGPRPVVLLSSGQRVVCDTVTDQGGWIVIQRRASDDVDFFRGWDDYKYGFGDLHGNFWLGLEKIHQLTSQVRHELRFDLRFEGKNYSASYDKFSLSGETDNYRIQISGFSGNGRDDMAIHNGQSFSTMDHDNDSSGINCASKYHGAWWYNRCHAVNLNGLWGSTEGAKGLRWSSVTLGSVSFSEMKIRPSAK